ncbi:MAG: hypothetical protein RLZZ602_1203 [Pseudomonadota bacterium]
MVEVGGSNPPGPTKIKKVYTVDMVYILYRTHGLHHCR